MLEIIVNGQRLDLPRQEVSVTRRSMVFGEVQDLVWSTDIEIPNTARNRKILGVPELLTNSTIVGAKTPCDVLYCAVSERGYIVISGEKSHALTASVFVSDMNNVRDMYLSDLQRDDADTIYPIGGMNTAGTLTFPKYGTQGALFATGDIYPVTQVSQICGVLNSEYGYNVTTSLASLANENLTYRKFC